MISLCMIVKNEERYIKQCIESALPLVDEIIVVDTGSNDRTKQIITSSFGAKVRIEDFKWCDDFSAARNKSLEYATNEWILLLDADENLTFDKQKIMKLLINTTLNAFNIPIHNLTEKGLPYITANMPRLFRRKDATYSGEIHEQLSYNENIPVGEILDSDLAKIIHFGYLDEIVMSKNKKTRNIEILKSAIVNNPENAYNWYKLGVTYMNESEYNKALDAFFKWSTLELESAPYYYTDVILRVASCLYSLRNYQELKIYLLNHLDDVSMTSNPDYFCRLGQLYQTLGDNNKAINYYSKAIILGEQKVNMAASGIGSFIPKYEISLILTKQKKVIEGLIYFIDSVFCKENIGMFGINKLFAVLENKKRLGLKKIIKDEQIKFEFINESLNKSSPIETNRNTNLVIEIETNINKGEIKLAKAGIQKYNCLDEKYYSIKGIIELIDGNYMEAYIYFIIGLRFYNNDFDLLYNLAFTAEKVECNELAKYYYTMCIPIVSLVEKKEIKDKIKSL